MSNLITEAEFLQFRNISKKVDSDKLKEAIKLAQTSDFQNALGGLYFDVLKNAGQEPFTSLLNGCEFTYEGEIYVHEGLKAFLADLTYSRFIYMVNVNLTPFGAQQKFTTDSNGVDRNTIKDLSKQAQIDGNLKYNIVQKYILSKPESFARYHREQGKEASFGGIRISKL